MPILTLEKQQKLKPIALFVDVTTVPNQDIEDTKQTYLETPLLTATKVFCYVINGTPSLFYKEAN